MHKRVFALIFVLIVLIAGFFFFNREKTPVDIRKVTGLPVLVADNVVQVDGVYSASYLPEKFQSRRALSFRVDENTQFSKQVIQMPAPPVLSPNSSSSRSYLIKDLPQTEGAGSFEDLKREVDLQKGSIYLEATFPESIHSIKKPLATEVFYRVVVETPPKDE
jgi:hypothetical protein